MFDCSLRSRGSRFEAAAFRLSLADEKRCLLARSSRHSGARSWARDFCRSLRSVMSLGLRVRMRRLRMVHRP